MREFPRLARIVALAAVALITSLMPATTAHADDLDVQVRAIAKRLQCPVCESVSVADSPSELAVQMRGVIRTRLEQGESEEEIVKYFVDRYGESVLVEPPRHGVALFVWLGPVVGLVLGAALLSLMLRGRRASPPRATESDHVPTSATDDWRVDAAQRELEQLGHGAPR